MLPRPIPAPGSPSTCLPEKAPAATAPAPNPSQYAAETEAASDARGFGSSVGNLARQTFKSRAPFHGRVRGQCGIRVIVSESESVDDGRDGRDAAALVARVSVRLFHLQQLRCGNPLCRTLSRVAAVAHSRLSAVHPFQLQCPHALRYFLRLFRALPLSASLSFASHHSPLFFLTDSPW